MRASISPGKLWVDLCAIPPGYFLVPAGGLRVTTFITICLYLRIILYAYSKLMVFFARRFSSYKQSITNILTDYAETFRSFGKYFRDNPIKCSISSSAFLLLAYFTYHCPDKYSYANEIISNTNEISLLPYRLRKRTTQDQIFHLMLLLDQGSICTFSIGPCRIAYKRRTPFNNRLYYFNSKFLIPSHLTFLDRILDIGFMNKWWFMDKFMLDYDVSDEE
ncbi:hypothetical protein LOD99_2044 [Oopsacas minuta]|uniref:Uncharacterized protein n=1 Tax=Oopsacas minuta TaxID=111878 RepID=A0AAV7K3B1_9METZ|nr:hypothetical protein LOD99_2044 [Oopsacas minuta]